MSMIKRLSISIPAGIPPLVEHHDEQDENCGFEIGCGTCKSKRCSAYLCQCFATTRYALVFFSLGAIIQGFIINGQTPAVISTLEKRFELTSTESGLIASCYDIAGSFAILFVTYIGGRGHKPLWIGWGIFLIGLSGILFSLPHFMAPPYSFSGAINLCGNPSSRLCTLSSLKNFRLWFYGSFIISGIGAAPLYSLSITYLDENVKQRYSSMYNAIFIAMSIIGPGAGFLVGAALLEEYTYIGQDVAIDESSEDWIGAWWIGYILFGGLGIIMAVPVLMLPRVIPGTERHRINREKEIHQLSKESSKERAFGKTFTDFPRCVAILLRNPTFSLLSVSIAVDSLLIGGIATFGAKYIEIQFGIDPSDSGTYFGLMAILGGAGGQLVGGGMISKFDFSLKTMLHMSYVAPLIAAFCSCCYLITCANPKIAGVTTSYHESFQLSPAIADRCNYDCGCNNEVYDPVCGSDGITYFSACFAGCSDKTKGVYTNCSCISTNYSNFENMSETLKASPGTCLDGQCNSGWEIIVFAVFNFLVMFFTFFNEASALQASIRCVGFNRRSFAIGFQILLSKIFGTVPGPLIMGFMFDKACLQWTEECGVQGSCLAYSNSDLSLSISLFLIIGKIAGVLLFVAALLTYKPLDKNMLRERGASIWENRESKVSYIPTIAEVRELEACNEVAEESTSEIKIVEQSLHIEAHEPDQKEAEYVYNDPAVSTDPLQRADT